MEEEQASDLTLQVYICRRIERYGYGDSEIFLQVTGIFLNLGSGLFLWAVKSTLPKGSFTSTVV